VIGVLLAAQLSILGYPDLVGMFAHATARLRNVATGQDVELLAWQHEGEPVGCAVLYRNANTTTWFDYSTGYYERFCIRGAWVRFMGQGSWPNGQHVYVRVESEGQDGQRYALVHATAAYSFTVDAEYVAPWGERLRYHDSQTWAPTPEGWVQQEIFRYPSPWNDWPGFQSVATFTPGHLFTSAHRTYVHRDGSTVHGDPIVNVERGSW